MMRGQLAGKHCHNHYTKNSNKKSRVGCRRWELLLEGMALI